MKKSIKNLFAGIVLATAMSNILTIEAAIYAPSEHFSNLKNIILKGSTTKELSNYNYDINNDSKKNVLDLCRMKKYALSNVEGEILDSVSKNVLSFSLGNISVDKTAKKITIPVSMSNNSNSINFFKLNVNFDHNSFTFADVTSKITSGNISYSVSGNTLSCNSSVPITTDGKVIDLVFYMKDSILNGTYSFSISQAEAYDDFGKLGTERINTSESEKSVKLTDVQNMFPADIPDPNNDSSKVQIYNWISTQREKAGVKALVFSKELSYVADIRAKELSVKIASTRPDGSSYRTLLSEYGMLTSHNIQLYSSDRTAQAYISTLSSGYMKEVTNGSLVKVGIGHYSTGSSNYWILYFTE